MADTITAETLADLETPSGICISPDGRLVVYSLRTVVSRKEEHATSSLWIAETGKEYSARQLTGGKANYSLPVFSPTGEYLAFLSDRDNRGKGPALYLLPLSGGEALPLTSTENEMEVSTYAWNPDGKSIAYASADEKSEERKKKEEDKDDVEVEGENMDFGRLRVISIEDRKSQVLVSGDFHVSELDWSPDGSEIAYSTTKTPKLNDVSGDENTINIVDKSGTSRRVCTFGSCASALYWISDPNSAAGKIVWLGDYDEEQIVCSKAVFTASPDQKVFNGRYGAFGTDSCPYGVYCSHDQIVVSVEHGLNDELHLLDSGEVIHNEPYAITSSDVCLKKDSRVLAIVKGTSGEPPEVFSIIDGKMCQLSSHGKAIADKRISKTVMFEYTTHDGFPVEAVYNVPKARQSSFDAHKPSPTIVIPHGGPHGRDTEDWSDWFHPYLLSKNYLILNTNYRGGSGHGNEFAKLVRGDPFASYQDVIFLIKKGIAAGYIDSDRVATVGWSQGGYLSYVAVSQDPKDFRFAAAIPGAGVSDWDLMSFTSDIECYESQLAGLAPWNVTDPKDVTARSGSPIYHMGQHIDTPTLIIHGEKDVRVPVSQATAFYRGMKALGKECEMAIYPREGHQSPWERKHYIDMLERIGRFLEKHLA